MKRALLLLLVAVVPACAASSVPQQSAPPFSATLRQATPFAPDASKVYARSAFYDVRLSGGQHYVGFLNTSTKNPCVMYRHGNVALGCYIRNGSQTLDVKKSTWELYTQKNAQGCELAVGHFKGVVAANATWPITFYVANASCWQT